MDKTIRTSNGQVSIGRIHNSAVGKVLEMIVIQGNVAITIGMDKHESIELINALSKMFKDEIKDFTNER
jgi:hypothetical protein